MLFIKTYLREVPNKGIGLFTGEDIPQGKCIQYTESLFSKTYPRYIVANFTDIEREFYNTYMIHLPDGSAILDLDNTRFINHSSNPNLSTTLEKMIALRDIKIGEELTIDYRVTDSEYGEELDFEVYE